VSDEVEVEPRINLQLTGKISFKFDSNSKVCFWNTTVSIYSTAYICPKSSIFFQIPNLRFVL